MKDRFKGYMAIPFACQRSIWYYIAGQPNLEDAEQEVARWWRWVINRKKPVGW